MGLVPDEKLVDLLDFALSADTVNTVRNMKNLTVSGVEPLNLVSQLGCLITRILAGGYHIPKGKEKRRFFLKKRCKLSPHTNSSLCSLYCSEASIYIEHSL